MQNLINVLLVFLLVSLGESALGSQLLNVSQSEGQEASQEPQTPPSQGQATSNAEVQSVTGCVIKSDNGYSLKTESDTYPIETDNDLSQYVNKQVKITGILEHHNATAPSSTGGNPTTITDIRLRMIATVIGDCKESAK